MTIHDLDAPALLIDANVLDANLRKMAKYCNDHKLALRPHTKTHKMPEIARLQLQHGATGITVAKPGEAEVMADAALRTFVIVYPLWGEKKWARLVNLAGRVRITVAIDSLAVAAGISKAAKAAGREIGIRAEFDTGFHRCGWPITAESMNEIQKMIALPGLRWDGILVYPGHIMGNQIVREQDMSFRITYALVSTCMTAPLWWKENTWSMSGKQQRVGKSSDSTSCAQDNSRRE